MNRELSRATSIVTNAKQLVIIGLAAFFFGATAWPVNASAWHGEIPGAILSCALAILSFAVSRRKPRVGLAIALSLLALTGASMRQTYERHRIQAYCEVIETPDCGQLLWGLPKLGWPVILAPLLGVLFSGVLVSQKSFAASLAQVKLKELPLPISVGLSAILGGLTLQKNIFGLYDDLPAALLSFGGVFLSLVSLRSSRHRSLAATALSIAAFAGVFGRYNYEREAILADCLSRGCLGITLPTIPEFGWSVVLAPFLAFAFMKIAKGDWIPNPSTPLHVKLK